MKATVHMGLSTHAAGRQSEVQRMEEAERVENDDMIEHNSWACYSGTFVGCCQMNLADDN